MTKEVLLTNVRSDGRWVGDCVSPRVTVPVISRIPVLGAVFTNFYPFELIILVMVAILWYIMSRTRYGMHLRACGDNPQAADTVGIKVNRVRFTAVMFSGALSGFGGMCFAYSISSSFSDLAMTIPYILTLLLLVFFSKNNRVPRALGEVYDKSKR